MKGFSPRRLRGRLCLLAVLGAILAVAPAQQAFGAVVLNGSFESGDFSGWTVWNQTGSSGNWYVYTGTVSPQSSYTIAAPPDGTYAATTDAQAPGSHILYRDVTLTAGFNHTLSFLLYYANRGSGFTAPSTLDYMGTPNQQYRVDIMNPAAPVNSMTPSDILANVFQTQVGDPLTKSPTLYTADLSPFAGQTIRIRFAEVDNQFYFQASFDKLAVATTGKLEVKKSLSPPTDPGVFDLKIDGTTQMSNAGDGGTTGKKQVVPGTHTVSEGAGTNTALTNYHSAIACRDNGGAGSIIAQSSDAGPLDVTLAEEQDVVCTITNTRKTGKLEVKKSLSPSTDPGLFDLKIDGVTQKNDATDGGTTGEKTVGAGTHTVFEGGGTGTNLSDYTSSVVCRDGDGSGSVVAAGSGAVPLNVSVIENADIVCTITNTRNTGTIEVVKDLLPASDPGKFNLQVDGTTKKTDAVDGDTTGAVTVYAGANHSVGELAGTGTSIGDYTSAIACTRNGSAANSGSGTSLSGISVAKNDVVVCTITNTHNTGTIEVVKDLLPASDPGKFNLQVDGTTKKADAVDGDTTGAVTVDAGANHSVGELAGTGTSIGDYTSAIACTRNGSAANSGSGTSLSGISVAKNDVVVCTITNTRNTGTIEVVKDLLPASDPGKFNLQVDGTTKKTDAVDGGTTGPVTVTTGTNHSVAELAGTGTTLSDYTSAIACTRNGSAAESGAGTSLSGISVAKNDVVVCTITNTRHSKIIVRKDAVPNDPQNFSFTAGGGLSPASFQLDDDGDNSNGVSNTQVFDNLAPGNGYSVAETTPGGWYLAKASCDDGSPVSNVGVALGETVTCTFVNSVDYSHPIGASPIRVSLVPAFEPCDTGASDSLHGTPLNFPSCSNPKPVSSTVTTGPNSIGFVRVVVCPANAGSAFCNPAGGAMPRPDVRFTGSLRDVKCASTLPPGQTACAAPGADYNPSSTPGPYTDTGNGTGGAQPPCFPTATSTTACLAGTDLTQTAELAGATVGGVGTNFMGTGIRVTDRNNGPSAAEAATTVDIGFPIPLDCIPTVSATLGSSCGVNTTANALAPGVVTAGKVAVWQIGEFQIKDSGPDGVRGSHDDEIFEVQGYFIP